MLVYTPRGHPWSLFEKARETTETVQLKCKKLGSFEGTLILYGVM